MRLKKVLGLSATYVLAASLTATAASAATIQVSQRGDPAAGVQAHYQVMVNGTVIGSAYSQGTTMLANFTTPLAAGQIGSVMINYDNNVNINGQDRNLYVKSIQIDSEAVVVSTSPGVIYDREALDGINVIPGQVAMPSNGYLIFPHDRIPVMDPVPANISVLEGQSTTTVLSATDPDGDTMSWSTVGLPAFASLTDLGAGKAQITLSPASGNAGSNSFQVSVSDGKGPAVITPVPFQISRAILVNASGIPAAGVYPSFDVYINDQVIGSQSVSSSLQTYSFATSIPKSSIRRIMVKYTNDATVGAEDRNLVLQSIALDGVVTASTASGVNYDVGALDARSVQAGTTAMNSNGFMVFAFQNQVPVVTASDLVMNVGDIATMSISSADPDQDPMAISYGLGMPSFGAFSAPSAAASPGAATITFSPSLSQAGVYPITLIATDTYGGIGSKTVNVTVNNILTVAGPTPASLNVLEGQSATIALSASSSAGKPISWTATGLPAMATLTDLGGGNAQIVVAPGSGSAGTYSFQVTASDGIAANVTTPVSFQVSRAILVKASGVPAGGIFPSFKVYVNDQVIGDQAATSSLQTYSFATNVPKSSIRKIMIQYYNDGWVGTEDRGLILRSITLDGVETVSASSSVFYDIGLLDARSVVAGTASVNWNGYLLFVFQNQLPVPISSDLTMNAGSVATVNVSASDPDQDPLVLSVSTVPKFAAFSDNGSGNGTFTFSPAPSDVGVYSFFWKSADTYGAIVYKWIKVTVKDAPGVFFVAQNGVDTNPGTFSLPFLTIQKAASVAAPGNTVYVRAGTYRETVVPANSGTQAAPITFAAYPGEIPVVSGADLITGLGNPVGSVYSSSAMNWSLGAARDQLFVDGKMILEARWPNGTTSVSTPVTSRVESVTNISHATSGPSLGTTATLYDSKLTQASGYWVGTRIVLITGSQWNSALGSVTASAPGQITVLLPKYIDSYYDPVAGNPYWLEAKASEIDSAGEWFRDSTSGNISVWMPASDSPATHIVEAKRRDYGFDLSALSYIQLQGISLFATSLKTGPASTGVVLDGLQARYVSHNFVPAPGLRPNTGIILDGTGNILKNCDIAYSSGNGVRLLGSGHTVTQCVVHDTDYVADYSANISVTGSNHVISFNSLYRTGRSAIDHGASNIKILNNELFDFGLQTADLGGTYTYANDGGGSEIAYNLVHGSGTGLRASNAGIYLDNASINYIVHNNVLWDVESGFNVNGFNSSQTPPANNDANIKIYQNSSYGSSLCGVGSAQNAAVAGYFFANNLCTQRTYLMPTATLQTNLQDNPFNSNFQSPDQADFRLRAGALAIGAGSTFSGSSSDLGALPYGQNLFSAGAQRSWPVAPSGLTAVATGNTSVQVNWSTAPAGTSLIRLSRGSAGGASRDIAVLPASATSFLDTGLTQNTDQAYFVRAENSNGWISPASSRVHARTLGSVLASGLRQAEAADGESGMDFNGGTWSGIVAGDWLSFTNLDFGAGALAHLRLTMATTSGGVNYEVHLDALNGPLVGTGTISNGNSLTSYHYMIANLSPVPTGVHSVYIVFKGPVSGFLDSLEFY